MIKHTVLVIEDELDILDNIRIILKAEKYIVFCCADGKTGCEKAMLLKPDIIICDIMMPEMDGYEVLKKIRKNKNTESIGFVFLTSKSERADFRLGMELGADDFVTKPFKSEELLNAIKIRIKRIKEIGRIDTSYLTQGNSEKLQLSVTTDRLFIKSNGFTYPIRINHIKAIESNNQYSNIIFDDKKKIVVRKSLNDWECILPKDLFIRIHRTAIINMDCLEKLKKIKRNNRYDYIAILKNTNISLPVSRKQLDKFMIIT